MKKDVTLLQSSLAAPVPPCASLSYTYTRTTPSGLLGDACASGAAQLQDTPLCRRGQSVCLLSLTLWLLNQKCSILTDLLHNSDRVACTFLFICASEALTVKSAAQWEDLKSVFTTATSRSERSRTEASPERSQSSDLSGHVSLDALSKLLSQWDFCPKIKTVLLRKIQEHYQEVNIFCYLNNVFILFLD